MAIRRESPNRTAVGDRSFSRFGVVKTGGEDVEEPLAGGDVTEGVVRVGDTVRRPVSGVSESVRQVLGHLESVRFAGAPRFRGIDAKDRDILDFIAGEVAGRPWPAW